MDDGPLTAAGIATHSLAGWRAAKRIKLAGSGSALRACLAMSPCDRPTFWLRNL